MAKATKRKQRPKTHNGVKLSPDEAVERDMRRSVKRQKNIRRLQGQIRRELAKSRAQLNGLVEMLIRGSYVDGVVVSDARGKTE